MAHTMRAIVALAACFSFPVLADAGTVTVTVQDGLVTVVADNATPREILAEWARVGEVRIVNGERVPGAPLTLRLEGVPERKALDIILRGAAGYMVAAREAGSGPAYFDRIVILPTSNTAAAVAARPATPTPAPIRRPGQPAENGMLGFSATPTEMTPEETNADPSGLVPQAPVLNPYGQPQSPYDQQNPYAQPGVAPANPYGTEPAGADGQVEAPNLPQAPALFPGSPAAPGGVVPAAPDAGAAAVPGGAVGASRPGEVVQPPTQATPYLNPYNIGARPPASQQPPPAARPGSSTTRPPQPPRQ